MVKENERKYGGGNFYFFSEIPTLYLIEEINYLNFIKSNLLNYLN